MKAYKGQFIKKDGTIRDMNFVRLSDLDTEFIESKTVGSKVDRKLPDGMEIVFDLFEGDFRTFNWNNTTKPVENFDISDKDFYEVY